MGCTILAKNKDDQKLKEIFMYLLKVSSYDKSMILR